MNKNPSPGKPRTLKVYERTLVYHAGCLYSSVASFPEIRLMGKWLADCGFQPGQHIDIATDQNKLIITLSSPYNEEADIKINHHEKAKIKKLAEKIPG